VSKSHHSPAGIRALLDIALHDPYIFLYSLNKLICKISFNALLTSFDVHQVDNAGPSKFFNGYPQNLLLKTNTFREYHDHKYLDRDSKVVHMVKFLCIVLEYLDGHRIIMKFFMIECE